MQPPHVVHAGIVLATCLFLPSLRPKAFPLSALHPTELSWKEEMTDEGVTTVGLNQHKSEGSLLSVPVTQHSVECTDNVCEHL